MLSHLRTRVRDQRFPIQIHIATIIIVVLFVSGVSVATFNYYKTTHIVEANQVTLFDSVSDNILLETRSLLDGAQSVTATLSTFVPSIAEILKDEARWLSYFQEVLSRQEALTAVYVGDTNGDFYLVRALRVDAHRTQFDAPSAAMLMVNSVEKGQGNIRFFSDDRRELQDDLKREYPYDPRTREWFKMAVKQQKVIVTPPYRFFSGDDIGFTIAQLTDDATKVVGVDLALSRLSQSLSGQVFSPNTQVALYGPRHHLLAHSDPDKLNVESSSQLLKKLSESDSEALVYMDGLTAAGTYHFEINGQQWRGAIDMLGLGIANLYLAVVSPVDELLVTAKRSRDITILISLFIIVCSVPMALWMAGFISRPLKALKEQSEAIMAFDFERATPVDSAVLEVFQLSGTIQKLSQTIEQFAKVSTIVGKEDHFDQLLQHYLDELKIVANMPSAAIYLTDADGDKLAASRGEWPRFSDNLSEVDHPLTQSLGGLDTLTSVQSGYVWVGDSAHSFLACPLLDKEMQRVGIMVFLDHPTRSINPQLTSFMEALSSVITVAVENRRLIEHQKTLMHAFIRLIAQAIDAKSPYTGKHCERVPELTKMLAESAQQQREGVFADFSLSDNQWEELFIASWLHDCGKVTTPEYIVDKATKLETIYDRIHEIRMRFEVLKRDAEVNFWREKAQGNKPSKEALKAQLKEYDKQFSFVAECNLGTEFMSDEAIERLNVIAKQTWTRTLDDRLGLSHLTLQRFAQPQESLPVQEQLLANKIEHRIPRASSTEHSKYESFTLKRPPLAQNEGELYNLSISRGTLNEEERFKINDHIIQTIIMLEELPFPSHLSAVAEIAGGHHEKMNGTGYPRGLKGEEMSVTARMMAVADIFEALTASDRPYKRGKTLSEALKIMSFMVKDAHIDADLFQLFLEDGVYLHYAEQFMAPEQIDDVDIAAYLPKKESKMKSPSDMLSLEPSRS